MFLQEQSETEAGKGERTEAGSRDAEEASA